MKLNYFNFKQIKDKILLTNDFGCHQFVTNEEFKKILNKDIEAESKLYEELSEKKFLYNTTKLNFTSSLKGEMRYIKNHVNVATSLHIFVVTTACNMNCIYCQANNGEKRPSDFMTKEIAEKSVDISLQSPEHFLTFEFQGGEPLLNFEVIKHIVWYAEQNKGHHEINYNIVTNLT